MFELEELLDEFLTESLERLERCEHALLRLEHEGDCEGALVRDIYREFHTLKGNASHLGLKSVVAITHACEALVQRCAEENQPADDHICEVLLHCCDKVRHLLSDIPSEACADISDQLTLLTFLSHRN